MDITIVYKDARIEMLICVQSINVVDALKGVIRVALYTRDGLQSRLIANVRSFKAEYGD